MSSHSNFRMDIIDNIGEKRAPHCYHAAARNYLETASRHKPNRRGIKNVRCSAITKESSELLQREVRLLKGGSNEGATSERDHIFNDKYE